MAASPLLQSFAALESALTDAGEADCPEWLNQEVWLERQADRNVAPEVWQKVIETVEAIAKHAVKELSGPSLPPWACALGVKRAARHDSSASEADEDETLTVAAGRRVMVESLGRMCKRFPPPFAFQQAVVKASLSAVTALGGGGDNGSVTVAEMKRVMMRQSALLQKTGLGDLLALVLVESSLSCVARARCAGLTSR